MNERLEIKASFTVDDAGTITGLAWPFGSPDRVGDVIEKGAITAPATLPMLFAHDQSQVIGVWDSIAETAEGLQVKGRLLVEDVERAREVRAMIRSKAVTGLSIGFVTKSAKAMNAQMEIAEIARAVEHTRRFNEHIANGGAILSAIMPNGKTLGECTGEEIGRYGAWLQEAGRQLDALKASLRIPGLLDWDASDDRNFPEDGMAAQ